MSLVEGPVDPVQDQDQRTSSSSSSSPSDSSSSTSSSLTSSSVRDTHSTDICRICHLSVEDDPTRPLYHPCLCSGSIALVHHDCLFTWLTSRTTSDSDIPTDVDISNTNGLTFKCEICHHSITFRPSFLPSAPLYLTFYDTIIAFLSYFKGLIVGFCSRITIYHALYLFPLFLNSTTLCPYKSVMNTLHNIRNAPFSIVTSFSVFAFPSYSYLVFVTFSILFTMILQLIFRFWFTLYIPKITAILHRHRQMLRVRRNLRLRRRRERRRRHQQLLLMETMMITENDGSDQRMNEIQTEKTKLLKDAKDDDDNAVLDAAESQILFHIESTLAAFLTLYSIPVLLHIAFNYCIPATLVTLLLPYFTLSFVWNAALHVISRCIFHLQSIPQSFLIPLSFHSLLQSFAAVLPSLTPTNVGNFLLDYFIFFFSGGLSNANKLIGTSSSSLSDTALQSGSAVSMDIGILSFGSAWWQAHFTPLLLILLFYSILLLAICIVPIAQFHRLLGILQAIVSLICRSTMQIFLEFFWIHVFIGFVLSCAISPLLLPSPLLPLSTIIMDRLNICLYSPFSSIVTLWIPGFAFKLIFNSAVTMHMRFVTRFILSRIFRYNDRVESLLEYFNPTVPYMLRRQVRVTMLYSCAIYLFVYCPARILHLLGHRYRLTTLLPLSSTFPSYFQACFTTIIGFMYLASVLSAKSSTYAILLKFAKYVTFAISRTLAIEGIVKKTEGERMRFISRRDERRQRRRLQQQLLAEEAEALGLDNDVINAMADNPPNADENEDNEDDFDFDVGDLLLEVEDELLANQEDFPVIVENGHDAEDEEARDEEARAVRAGMGIRENNDDDGNDGQRDHEDELAEWMVLNDDPFMGMMERNGQAQADYLARQQREEQRIREEELEAKQHSMKASSIPYCLLRGVAALTIQYLIWVCFVIPLFVTSCSLGRSILVLFDLNNDIDSLILGLSLVSVTIRFAPFLLSHSTLRIPQISNWSEAFAHLFRISLLAFSALYLAPMTLSAFLQLCFLVPLFSNPYQYASFNFIQGWYLGLLLQIGVVLFIHAMLPDDPVLIQFINNDDNNVDAIHWNWKRRIQYLLRQNHKVSLQFIHSQLLLPLVQTICFHFVAPFLVVCVSEFLRPYLPTWLAFEAQVSYSYLEWLRASERNRNGIGSGIATAWSLADVWDEWSESREEHYTLFVYAFFRFSFLMTFLYSRMSNIISHLQILYPQWKRRILYRKWAVLQLVNIDEALVEPTTALTEQANEPAS